MKLESKTNIKQAIENFLERDKEAVVELEALWYLGEREQEKARIHFLSERIKDACALILIIGNQIIDGD